ncbi:MAG: glycosyltransferase [Spirochaetes bacterium]|nr:glycosyltransferase [Spirochaetota bacterium]
MLTIAIPVYNRLDLLKIMADSLYKTVIPVPYNIRVYDDCSTEFGLSELKGLFPDAASVRRNETNLRADGNMFAFYKDFLLSSDEYLFNADSDIIFNKNCFVRALDLIGQTEGVLSVFNAPSHPVKEVVDENFCIKETLGAAGTFFIRKRVQEIMGHFSALEGGQVIGFDWKWSRFLSESNVRIFCTNASLVQHIGYRGQNTVIPYKGYKKIRTHKPYFDYGKNFTVDSLETGQIINDIFHKFTEHNRLEDERIVYIMANRPISKLKRFVKNVLGIDKPL